MFHLLYTHINQTEATKMNDLYQKTYMDLNEIKKVKRDYKPMLAAVALFAMYVFVSTMDYQDCLRGAMSC